MEITIKQRGKIARTRKPIILIATEGKNKTEKLYFNHFNKSKRYSIVFSRGNYTDPINMINLLEKEIRERELSKRDGDIAYCVFDTDCDVSKQEQINQAVHKCKTKNIELIKSNPCFEIWFIAHYSDSTKRYSSNIELINELKRFIPQYEKNKDVYYEVNSKTNIAIENSKKLENYHVRLGKDINNIECNPSTQVYKILEKIQSY